MKKYIITSVLILTVLFTGISKADAGTLFPTHVPGETMYSLQEIYDLATASTTASIGNGLPFNRPASVNGSMITLEELYNAVLALRNASSTDNGGGDDGGTIIEDGLLSITPYDNEDQIVEVDENSDTNDQYAYLARIKSETGINKIQSIEVDMTSPSGEELENMINTVYVSIDGDEFGSESASSTVRFEDIDLNVLKDDTVDFEIRVDINRTDDGLRYQNYDSIKITDVRITYIDQKDIIKFISSPSAGGKITFLGSGILVEPLSLSTEYSGDTSTKGKYTIKFNVSSIGDDAIYVPLSVIDSMFSIVDTSIGSETVATTTSVSLTSSALITSSHYKISEGDMETFTLTVYLDNLGGDTDKQLQVGLKKIEYKRDLPTADSEYFTADPAEDYRTNSLILFNVAQN